VAIIFLCPCSQQLMTDDSTAGGHAKCPKCSRILKVPEIQNVVRAAAPAPEDDEILLPDSTDLLPLENEPRRGEPPLRSPLTPDQPRTQPPTSPTPSAASTPPLELGAPQSLSQWVESLSAPPPAAPTVPSRPASAVELFPSSLPSSGPTLPKDGGVFKIGGGDAPTPTRTPTSPPRTEESLELTESHVVTPIEVTDADLVTPGAAPAPPALPAGPPPGATPPPLPLPAQGAFHAGQPPASAPGGMPVATLAPAAPEVEDEPILEEDKPAEGWYDAHLRPTKAKKKSAKKLREEREKMRAESSQLRTTSTGLMFIYWSVMCIIAAIIVAIITWIAMIVLTGASAMAADREQGMLQALGIVGFFVLLLFALGFAAGILYLVGAFFCCWAPTPSGARRYMIISLSLSLGGGVPYVLSFFLLIAGGMLGPTGMTVGLIAGAVLSLISIGMAIGAFCLFFLFIRKFSYYLEETGIAEEAMDIMILWLWLHAYPLVLILLNVVGITMPELLLVAMILGGLGNVIWSRYYIPQWIRMLNMMASLRQVLLTFYGM
jgi:hypothetical protein